MRVPSGMPFSNLNFQSTDISNEIPIKDGMHQLETIIQVQDTYVAIINQMDWITPHVKEG